MLPEEYALSSTIPANEIAGFVIGFGMLYVVSPASKLDAIIASAQARSLARDLGEKKLSETHRVKRLAAFDHFPWHADFLEVVCQLEKKE